MPFVALRLSLMMWLCRCGDALSVLMLAAFHANVCCLQETNKWVEIMRQVMSRAS